MIEALEHSPDPVQHRDALAEVLLSLAEAGMDYFFRGTLQKANSGFVIEQSARLGMAATLQVMGPFIRNIIGFMDKRQLLSVCGSVREYMR